MSGSITYLDLGVPPYRFALRADCVLGVVQDVDTQHAVRFRHAALPVADLRRIFANRSSTRLPFAVAIEAAEGRALVGVDTVGHLRQQGLVVPVPAFGLLDPELFEGALREASGLLLILAPPRMVRLASDHRESVAIFDPQ